MPHTKINKHILFVGLVYLTLLVVGLCCYHSFRIDIVETFFMGNEAVVLYPKHPFLTFWVTHFFSIALESLTPYKHSILKNHIFFAETLSVLACYFISVYAYKFTHSMCAENGSQSRTKNTNQRCAYLVLYGVTAALILKRIEFTPDLFFILFSTLFVCSTYGILQKDSTSNYIKTLVFGWLLIFTKYQAILIFVCSVIPFVFSASGRKVLFSKKCLIFSTIFATPIIMYFTFVLYRHASSVGYAFAGKSHFNNLVIFKILGSYILKCNIVFVALLVIIKPFRLAILRSLPLCLNVKNEKTLFLLTHSVVFVAMLTALVYIYKPDGVTRYIISNIIFIVLFTVYIFKESVEKHLSEGVIARVGGVVLILATLYIVYIDTRENRKNIYNAYKNIATQIENQTAQGMAQNFKTVLYQCRQYELLYPLFQHKLSFVNSVETQTLSNNFIVITKPNVEIKAIQAKFPNYTLAEIFTVHANVHKQFSWQKNEPIEAVVLFFKTT